MPANLTLLANGEPLDVASPDDLGFEVTVRLFDPADLKATVGNYTLGLKAPRTLRNDRLLGYIAELDLADAFLEVPDIQAQLNINEVTVLSGRLLVEGFDAKNYRLQLVGNNIAWSEAISGRSLQDLSGTEYLFSGIKSPARNPWPLQGAGTVGLAEFWASFENYTPSTIANPELAFPLVSYGNFGCDPQSFLSSLTNPNQPLVDSVDAALYNTPDFLLDQLRFYPCPYLRVVVRRIFEEAGWQVGGTFFESQEFENLVLAYVDDQDQEPRWNWGLLLTVNVTVPPGLTNPIPNPPLFTATNSGGYSYVGDQTDIFTLTASVLLLNTFARTINIRNLNGVRYYPLFCQNVLLDYEFNFRPSPGATFVQTPNTAQRQVTVLGGADENILQIERSGTYRIEASGIYTLYNGNLATTPDMRFDRIRVALVKDAINLGIPNGLYAFAPGTPFSGLNLDPTTEGLENILADTVLSYQAKDPVDPGYIQQGQPASFSFSVEVFLEAGDFVGLFACDNGANVFFVRDTVLTAEFIAEEDGTAPRQTLSIASALPDIDQGEFIASVLTQFNLFVTVDETQRLISLDPFDRVFLSAQQALDWTAKADLALAEGKPANAFREVKFRYADDEDQLLQLADYEPSFVNDNRSAVETQDVEVLFAPTANRGYRLVGASGPSPFTTPILLACINNRDALQQTLGDLGSGNDILRLDYSPRILRWYGLTQFGPSFVLEDGTSITSLPVAYFAEPQRQSRIITNGPYLGSYPAGTFLFPSLSWADNLRATLDGAGLARRYWFTQLAEQTRAKLLELDAALNEQDVNNADGRRLININGLTYILVEISNYNPAQEGLTKIILQAR